MNHMVIVIVIFTGVSNILIIVVRRFNYTYCTIVNYIVVIVFLYAINKEYMTYDTYLSLKLKIPLKNKHL